MLYNIYIFIIKFSIRYINNNMNDNMANIWILYRLFNLYAHVRQIKCRYWQVFFITRLIDHQISSGRWQMNRTQKRSNLYFLDIVHIIIVSMLFKIFVFFKYQKTHVLADFVHELKDIGIVDFLAKINFFFEGCTIWRFFN